jgi:hypothetical protein
MLEEISGIPSSGGTGMYESERLTKQRPEKPKPLQLNSKSSARGRRWARWASNPGPADYESAALTRLSYGPAQDGPILAVSRRAPSRRLPPPTWDPPPPGRPSFPPAPHQPARRPPAGMPAPTPSPAPAVWKALPPTATPMYRRWPAPASRWLRAAGTASRRAERASAGQLRLVRQSAVSGSQDRALWIRICSLSGSTVEAFMMRVVPRTPGCWRSGATPPRLSRPRARDRRLHLGEAARGATG